MVPDRKVRNEKNIWWLIQVNEFEGSVSSSFIFTFMILDEHNVSGVDIYRAFGTFLMIN